MMAITTRSSTRVKPLERSAALALRLAANQECFALLLVSSLMFSSFAKLRSSICNMQLIAATNSLPR
jgi:hypothetical protein